jgi:hypothetical protein
MRYVIKAIFALLAALFISGSLDAAVVIPGYTLNEYTNVTDPRAMSFDASGNLYVGRDNVGSGGGFSDPVQIQRVATDRSVSPFGSPISDPDLVIVDLSGAITGVAGSVIVGGGSGGGTGPLTAIHPDGSMVQLQVTGVLSDVNGMALNSQGQLIIGDDVGLARYADNTLTRLVSLPGTRIDVIDVDSTDRVFATSTDNTLKIFAADGTLLDGSFVTNRYLRFAFGNGGAFGDDLYGIDQLTGELVHVSDSGSIDVIGSGFGNTFLTFGNDGGMYVSDFDNDRILQITPVPEPSGLANWIVALAMVGIWLSLRSW